MGEVIVKIKVMPESGDTNLEDLKEKLNKVLEEKEAKGSKFEEQPIAFGLKALFITFVWPEEKELDVLENALKETEGVGSLQVEDMRRAIG